MNQLYAGLPVGRPFLQYCMQVVYKGGEREGALEAGQSGELADVSCSGKGTDP